MERRVTRATSRPCRLRSLSPTANLVQRITKLLLQVGCGKLNLTPWQLSKVQKAIEQLEEERFAEGERTMSEAERADLYEPAGYVARDAIGRQFLVG
jgi:hypothetical protein